METLKIRAVGPGFDKQNISHRVFGGAESEVGFLKFFHLGGLGLKNWIF